MFQSFNDSRATNILIIINIYISHIYISHKIISSLLNLLNIIVYLRVYICGGGETKNMSVQIMLIEICDMCLRFIIKYFIDGFFNTFITDFFYNENLML